MSKGEGTGKVGGGKRGRRESHLLYPSVTSLEARERGSTRKPVRPSKRNGRLSRGKNVSKE